MEQSFSAPLSNFSVRTSGMSLLWLARIRYYSRDDRHGSRQEYRGYDRPCLAVWSTYSPFATQLLGYRNCGSRIYCTGCWGGISLWTRKDTSFGSRLRFLGIVGASTDTHTRTRHWVLPQEAWCSLLIKWSVDDRCKLNLWWWSRSYRGCRSNVVWGFSPSRPKL